MAEQVPEAVDIRAQGTPRFAATDVAPAPAGPVAVGGEDLIDLRFIFAAVWRGKWLLLALTIAGALYGAWDMRKFVPQYETSMIVAPTPGAGVTKALGRKGNIIASTFGLSTGDQQATTFDRLKLSISSLMLAQILDQKHGYLQKIFSGSWDPEKKEWKRPSGRRFEWEQRIRSIFHLPTWSEPSVEKLAEHLKNTIKITDHDIKPFYRISYAHVDRDFAYEVLSNVYNEADEMLREQDRQATAVRKAYLEERLQSASMLESRDIIYGLLASEEHKSMMLQGTLPYAASVAQPMRVSPTPTSPAVSQFIGFPVAVFITLGVLLILLVALFRREG